MDFGAQFPNSNRLRRLLSQFLQDRAHYPGSARSVEPGFRLNVMDWPGAVDRRKFFQVRAERFGGRVKICNLMSAAALSCPPFNTQCKKSKNKKTKKRNSISKSYVRCAPLYPPFDAKKARKIKETKMCNICPRLNSVYWLAWVLQQEMPFYSMDVYNKQLSL